MRRASTPFLHNRIVSEEAEHLADLALDAFEDTPSANIPRGALLDLAGLYASGRGDGALHTADLKALVRQALLATGQLEREDLDQLFDLSFGRTGIQMSKRAEAWLEDLLPSTMDAVVTREDLRELRALRKARSVLKRALRDLVRSPEERAPLTNLEVRFHSGYHLVLDVVTIGRGRSARDVAKRVRRVLRSRGMDNVRARVVIRSPATENERAWFAA